MPVSSEAKRCKKKTKKSAPLSFSLSECPKKERKNQFIPTLCGFCFSSGAWSRAHQSRCGWLSGGGGGFSLGLSVMLRVWSL